MAIWRVQPFKRRPQCRERRCSQNIAWECVVKRGHLHSFSTILPRPPCNPRPPVSSPLRFLLTLPHLEFSVRSGLFQSLHLFPPPHLTDLFTFLSGSSPCSHFFRLQCSGQIVSAILDFVFPFPAPGSKISIPSALHLARLLDRSCFFPLPPDLSDPTGEDFRARYFPFHPFFCGFHPHLTARDPICGDVLFSSPSPRVRTTFPRTIS